MNTLRNILLATTALTAMPALGDELLPEAHYADELSRCVAQIRTELNVGADDQLQHTVTDIEKKNVWYTFSIETSDGQFTANSNCRAWRFSDKAIADVSLQAPDGTRLADAG